jgi:hypothetical protein
MTARRITAKDGADAIAMLDQEKKARTPRLHLDAKTGATVLTPKVEKTTKAAPVKHSALRDDKLSLRVVKMTMADRVRQQFGIGASLTEAAKATGADPAYVWDLAKVYEQKTGTRVPRSGRAPKVVAVATEKADASEEATS